MKNEKLSAASANKEFSSLRRMFRVNHEMDGLETANPFARITIKESQQITRIPFTDEQIRLLLKPENLEGLALRFELLLKLLVNTGMRPVEAIGFELGDIFLEEEVPHVHIRKNSVRGLKTDHSERLIPLVGVSLESAQELVKIGGWGKYLGKNMYATSRINRHFRDTDIITDKRQSLYSLRHRFQDQLTKRDVIDRAQAQLMGHKFHRPKYGFGKDLSELRDIILPFAI